MTVWILVNYFDKTESLLPRQITEEIRKNLSQPLVKSRSLKQKSDFLRARTPILVLHQYTLGFKTSYLVQKLILGSRDQYYGLKCVPQSSRVEALILRVSIFGEMGLQGDKQLQVGSWRWDTCDEIVRSHRRVCHRVSSGLHVQAPGAGPQRSYPGALDSNFQWLQKGAGTVLIFKPQGSVAFCYDSLRRLI